MLTSNSLYLSDLSLAASKLDSSLLNEKSFLITGSTGLICSCIIDLILSCNRIYNSNAIVYAAGRNKAKTLNRFANNSNVRFVEYDALKEINFDFSVDYIIHGAGNASPELYVSQPVETMLMNFSGINNLLRYAKENGIKRTLYISSSEIYGINKTDEAFKEDDYGYIDILSPRASYSVSKRASETLCISYAEEYGLDTVIVRPGHIYGPTASENDNRVSSAFAHKAASSEPIIMKSAGLQIRSYCYCVDCALAILTVLFKGECNTAYNISNKNSILSIRHMAEILAEQGNVSLSVSNSDETERIAFNPMSNSSLNSSRIEALGFNGLFTAEEGLDHTIRVLKADKQ